MRGMRRLAGLLLTVLMALAAMAPGAASAERDRPDRERAERALEHAAALKRGHGVQTGRELSLALNRLAAALPALSGADRRAGERLLARPTDGDADPQDDGYKPTSALDRLETAHFVVHYVKAPPGDPDATDLADVEMIAATLEEAYDAEVGTLAWRPPPGDEGREGDDRVDVYLKNILDREIFGYVAIDPGQPSSSAVPHFAYMVLDNGYTEIGANREDIIKATVAHELNHVLQNGYDFLQDAWMFESTAVWMEEAVYPQVNDYFRYVNDWVSRTHVPLAAFRLDPATGEPNDDSIKAYGSAVWNHWVSGRYGPEAVREAWARSVDTGDFAPGAYNAEIAARGAGGFAEEFERFAAGTAEWRAPGNGFPDLYPEVARSAAVPADGSSVQLTMDHTTFRHLDVPLAGLSTPTVQVTATFPDAIAGAVALVGRTGGDTDGAVTTRIGRAPAGGVARARIDDPSQFARLTAVVVNSDTTQFGFDPATQDWVFRDGQAVLASVDSARAPSGNTAEPLEIKDKSATLSAFLAANVFDTAWRFDYGRTDRYGATVRAPVPLQNGNVAERVSLPVAKLRPSTVYHYRVVAENSLGSLIGEDRILVTADDVTKPVFVLRQPRSARRARGLPARVRCDEACRLTASVVIDRRTARRFRVARTVARLRSRARENVTRRLRVRLPARTRARLARAGTLRATVTWRARDEFGNTTRVTRRLRLRR